MKYTFKPAKLPPNTNGLLSEINAAASRLAIKLERLNVQELNISDYNKRYFGGILQNVTAALQLRTYLLAWSLHNVKIPKDKIVFVDYGGGSGMLSLLAKEYGIGTVIYDDIFDISCRDAQLIAKKLGNEAEHYVCGDIDDLISFLQHQNLSCDILGSYDVLEHIYDIDSFLPKLKKLSKGAIKIVMGSGANPLNPYTNKVLSRKQVELELKDREPIWGAKDRDNLQSYLGIRRSIINEYLQANDTKLSSDKVEVLAKNTRGMNKVDIEKTVINFLRTGIMPKNPEHPTNTCDPYTGNWAEHLMNPFNLADTLEKSGFKARVISGYYGDSKSVLKKIVGRCLNLIVAVTGKAGLKFATFYTLYGEKNISYISNQKEL